MANQLSTEIEARIQTFVAELSTLVRRAALESVSEALGAKSAAPAPPAPTRRTPAMSPPSSTKLRPARRRGAKRDPNEIAKITDAVRAHVTEHPGEGVEAIAKHLGVPTSALALPISKLLSTHDIKKKGLKRATRYFPA